MRVEPDGGLTVERREVISDGELIRHYRSRLAGADRKTQEQDLLVSLGMETIGFELIDFQWGGLESSAVDSLTLTYTARLKGSVTSSGDLRLVKLPWRHVMKSLGPYISLPERRVPFITHPFRLHELEHLELELPAGWKLEGVPDPVDMEQPHGRLAVDVVARDPLTLDREVWIAPGAVGPKEYGEFRALVEEAVRREDEVLVVRTGR